MFRKIYFSKVSFLLMLFIFYVLFRSLIDFVGIGEFVSYSISPGGGILIYVLIGALLIAQQKLFLDIANVSVYAKLVLTTLIFFLILYILALLQIIDNLSQSIFLLDILQGSYQGPGKALIIFIIYIQFLILELNFRKKSAPMSGLIFFVIAIISMFLSQAFGSNTAFVVIFFLLCNFYLFLFLKNRTKIGYLLSLPLHQRVGFSFFSRSFQSIMYGQVFWVIITIVVLASVLFLFFYEQISLFRIFSFGDFTRYDSITSRYELLANFIPQAEYRLIFGHLDSDSLTTGEGTYPHSFVLSLISHTGIMGLFIFLLFLLMFLKTIFKSTEDSSFDIKTKKLKSYFAFSTFSILFLYANAATFFAWVPIWFFFGCTINMYNFNTHEKSISSSSQ